MDIYSKIKQKRLQLGLSQDDLALKTGYKDRSSIAKIEKGKVDLSISKVKDFAKVLKTTPAYLMGWENEYSSASLTVGEEKSYYNYSDNYENLKKLSENYKIDFDDIELFELYLSLSTNQKNSFKEMAKTFIKALTNSDSANKESKKSSVLRNSSSNMKLKKA